uniref:ATPase subunit 8 n=1 Tax=Botrylloides leachii TaxID=62808 RepID=A0A024GX35_BOTLH|nr:ATP synthase F0 subunit 8 [Botrylloides leachii]CCO25707.1 ATPase subunit 8 [Botrylloides leachii]CDM98935.1 ATPase subunit 8 [Botrylloides leachii]
MPQLNFLSFFVEFVCFLFVFILVAELFKRDEN